MECLLDAELMKTCKENDLKISRSSPEWPLVDTGLMRMPLTGLEKKISLNLYVRIVRILRVWEGLEPSLYIEF